MANRKSDEPTITVTDTGIFQRRRMHASGATHTPVAAQKVAESMFAQWQTWGDVDLEIRRIVNNVRVARKLCPKTRPDLAHLAEHILYRVGDMQHAIKAGNAKHAAFLGLVVGAWDLQLRIQLGPEKYVKSGKGVCRRNAKCNLKKKEKADESDEQIRSAFLQAVERRGSRKQPTDTAIRVRLSADLGFSRTKVLNATKHLTKKTSP